METNAAAGDRFKFTGREWDAEIALYYYRARFYDPAIGRFVSQDPIGFAAGDANLYRYVGNSPLMYVDPLGLTASVSYPEFVRRARALANGMAGAAIGYVCGWVEAKYSNHPDPHRRAIEEMIQGFVLGSLVEGVSAFQRHRLWLGIAAVSNTLLTSEDVVIVGIRATCIMAEISSLDFKVGFSRRYEFDSSSVYLGMNGAFPFRRRTTKQGGRITEPNLPPKTIAQHGDVEIVHYTRSGDHGPPHLHVKGGGPETKIGQAGKPLDGSPELTATQARAVEANKSAIRKAVDQIGRWFRFNNAE